MKFLFLFVIISLSALSFAQNKIIKYYKGDSLVSKEFATWYVIESADKSTNHIYKEFYNLKDNSLEKIGFYTNDGIADGLSIDYLKNKQVFDSGYFNMGNRSGISYFFHHNGKLASIINFKEDSVHYLNCYDENGLVISCKENNESMPEFPGKMEGLRKFLISNIKYPKKAIKSGTEGKVIVKFHIDFDGSVKDPIVIKSVDPLLDAEALRVVSEMPNWKPGIQFDRAVMVFYTLPITFKLP